LRRELLYLEEAGVLQRVHGGHGLRRRPRRRFGPLASRGASQGSRLVQATIEIMR